MYQEETLDDPPEIVNAVPTPQVNAIPTPQEHRPSRPVPAILDVDGRSRARIEREKKKAEEAKNKAGGREVVRLARERLKRLKAEERAKMKAEKEAREAEEAKRKAEEEERAKTINYVPQERIQTRFQKFSNMAMGRIKPLRPNILDAKEDAIREERKNQREATGTKWVKTFNYS